MEVFYVSPPGLEDIKRWLRAQEMEAEKHQMDDLQGEHGVEYQ
jgi:hypothetical protein